MKAKIAAFDQPSPAKPEFVAPSPEAKEIEVLEPKLPSVSSIVARMEARIEATPPAAEADVGTCEFFFVSTLTGNVIPVHVLHKRTLDNSLLKRPTVLSIGRVFHVDTTNNTPPIGTM